MQVKYGRFFCIDLSQVREAQNASREEQDSWHQISERAAPYESDVDSQQDSESESVKSLQDSLNN